MTGRYDEDYSDPRQYCAHGTFIGSWWGPDYMCYWCETGETPPTPEEQARIELNSRLERGRRKEQEFDDLTKNFSKFMPYNASVANALVIAADNEYWAEARFRYHYQDLN